MLVAHELHIAESCVENFGVGERCAPLACQGVKAAHVLPVPLSVTPCAAQRHNAARHAAFRHPQVPHLVPAITWGRAPAWAEIVCASWVGAQVPAGPADTSGMSIKQFAGFSGFVFVVLKVLIVVSSL